MIAGSYSFGISTRLGSKISCTNSYMIILIFITVARRTVMIAGSYSFGISSQSGSKVSCTNSYMIILIFITVACSYSFDSWQLQFWDIIFISLKVLNTNSNVDT